MPDRTVYYMGDYWPTLPSQWQNYWQVAPRNWFTAVPKLILKPMANYSLTKEEKYSLALENVIFPTKFLQNEFAQLGIMPPESTIIYGAIDTKEYQTQTGCLEKENKDELSLLYIGRLSEDKGVHTAIQALSILVRQKTMTFLS